MAIGAIPNPCYKCEKRTADCHPTCKEYKDFVAANEAKKAAIRKQKAEDDDYRACRLLKN